MRKQILLALLGMAAMLTGCSREENADTAGKATSFCLGVDNGVVTRGAVDAPTRYIMEVYEGTTAVGAAQAPQVEQAENTFDVILKDGQEYTILFWADYGTAKGTDNEYDATKLREVKVATGKTATRAAFAGAVKFKVGTDNADVYTQVTLKHAVAQVNFKQTTALTAATNTLAVKYPESYSLNVEDGSTVKTTADIAHTFTYNNTEAGTMATDYIIAPTTEKALMTVKTTLNSEAEKEISNAPFQGNYCTNISGSFSDKYHAALTVTCDDTWGIPDNEANTPILITNTDLIAVIEENGITFTKTPEGYVDVTVNKSAIEGADVLYLDLCEPELTSLKGIEYFTNLTELSCSYNALTELDVTALTKLESLDCSENQLTALDVTPLTKLKSLDCSHNKLTSASFKITGNDAFTDDLDCSYNPLGTLDLTGFSKLSTLRCSYCEWSEIDLAPLSSLTRLECVVNKITKLDLSPVPNLLSLNCNSNLLTELDLSVVPDLNFIYCNNNRLKTLDISVTKIADNKSLVGNQNSADGAKKERVTIRLTSAQDAAIVWNYTENTWVTKEIVNP